MTTSPTPDSSTSLTRTSNTWSLNHAIIVLVVASTVVLLDQITKQLALSTFHPGEIRRIIDGVFNLTLSFNRGAAFGLWSGLQDGWREIVLGVTILLALGVVTFLLTRSYYQSKLAQIALAAILGGAIGNIIDRCIYGAVIDFLDFYIGTYHWPAFNIADSAICIGVTLLLFLPKTESVSSHNNSSQPAAESNSKASQP